jgi:hypothetical protein
VTVTEHIREHLLRQCGYYAHRRDAVPPLEQLRQTEWVAEFESLMRNRLIMGRFRYGPLAEPAVGHCDQMPAIVAHLCRYCVTGNLESLVDAANRCMIEFWHPGHPGAHWAPADDGEHVVTFTRR